MIRASGNTPPMPPHVVHHQAELNAFKICKSPADASSPDLKELDSKAPLDIISILEAGRPFL
jgi:hypothetical protein